LLNIATRTGGAEPHLYDYSRTPTEMYSSMAQDVKGSSAKPTAKMRLWLHVGFRWLASLRQAAINRNTAILHQARLGNRFGTALVRLPLLFILAPRKVIRRIRQQAAPGTDPS
jgi:hypothetical protein